MNSSEHILLVDSSVKRLTVSPLLDQYDVSNVPSEYSAISLQIYQKVNGLPEADDFVFSGSGVASLDVTHSGNQYTVLRIVSS